MSLLCHASERALCREQLHRKDARLFWLRAPLASIPATNPAQRLHVWPGMSARTEVVGRVINSFFFLMFDYLCLFCVIWFILFFGWMQSNGRVCRKGRRC